MIACTHCYEIFTDEFRENNEYCPFCHTMLPEPEPEPEPEPVAYDAPLGADGLPIDGTYPDGGQVGMYDQSLGVAAEPPKSKTTMIAIVAVVVVALAAGGYFMFGGKESSNKKVAAGPKIKKIDPKLIASLERLNQQAQKKIDNYFIKTCSTFRDQGYSYTTEITLDENGNWKSLIKPGTGTPLQNENLFLCPLKLTEIRSKSDMTLKVNARFQSGGLFGSAANYAKIEMVAKNLKAYDNFSNPTKELNAPQWNFAKGKMHIVIGGLRKGPQALRKINGTHPAYFKGRRKRAKLHIKLHGTELVQIKRKSGPGGIFGRYEAHIPAWFGKAQTKYIKDWGTGCSSDVTEQFDKIKKHMIEKHDDLELFEKSPQLKEYMDKAVKAGKALCSVMGDAYKIIKLYDENKRGEASKLEDEYRKALLKAQKMLRTELSEYIQSLKVSSTQKAKSAPMKK